MNQLQVQYDFFKENHEVEMEALGNLVISTVKKECEKHRKAMWTRYTEHSHQIEDIRRRIHLLEQNICMGL